MNVINKLKSGDKEIGIWGAGYIGLTTAIAFAQIGIKSVIYDINTQKIQNLRQGSLSIPNLEYWCGFDVAPLLSSNLIRATNDKNDMADCYVNFIAVPTEREMQPYYDALEEVVSNIYLHNTKKLIIIESTLTPGTIDNKIVRLISDKEFIDEDLIAIGIAPRRDWFISPDKNMKVLSRVVGVLGSEEDKKLIFDVLSLICDNIVLAKDYRSAEMVKSVENVIRYVEISLANQLSISFPNVDIKEVLQLAGTKWNINTLYPSLGIGGYCIPLSAEYILSSSYLNGSVSIVKEAKQFNELLMAYYIDNLKLNNCKSVGILGLSYKGNIKVASGSPTIELSNLLLSHGVHVKVNDPYFTDDEIEGFTYCRSFSFPNDLKNFDCIILMSNHREYNIITKVQLEEKIQPGALIIDNTGQWERYSWGSPIIYKRIGEKKWIH